LKCILAIRKVLLGTRISRLTAATCGPGASHRLPSGAAKARATGTRIRPAFARVVLATPLLPTARVPSALVTSNASRGSAALAPCPAVRGGTPGFSIAPGTPASWQLSHAERAERQRSNRHPDRPAMARRTALKVVMPPASDHHAVRIALTLVEVPLLAHCAFGERAHCPGGYSVRERPTHQACLSEGRRAGSSGYEDPTQYRWRRPKPKSSAQPNTGGGAPKPISSVQPVTSGGAPSQQQSAAKGTAKAQTKPSASTAQGSKPPAQNAAKK
jgi:hypothetical protein